MAAALESLLNQDFTDFELIVSDNASTDRTGAICEEYARRDPRIRYYRSEVNQGATWNFRRVLELARAPYFKWASHDDECRPALFGKCVAALEQAGPSAVLAYSRSEFIDESGTVIMKDVNPIWDCLATMADAPHTRLARVIRRNLYGQPIYGISRTDALRQARPFGNVAPDFIKLAELAMLGKIVEVPEVLFRLRRHEQNTARQYRSWVALLSWHDPGARRPARWMSKNMAIMIEYVRSAWHLRLPAGEKILCVAIAAGLPASLMLREKLLKLSGPLRLRLQALTGWRWLSRTGSPVTPPPAKSTDS